ncbi:hypothetical protein V6N13_071099 [Hibiscus sabdariffa]
MLQSAFISFLRRASFFLQIHFSWVQNAVFYTTWFCLKKKKAFQQELINEGRCYRNHFDFHSPSLKQCCRAQAEGISRAMKVMTFVMYLCSVTTLSDDPVQEWILTEGKATQITRVVASILQVAMKLILVLSLSKQLGMLCKDLEPPWSSPTAVNTITKPTKLMVWNCWESGTYDTNYKARVSDHFTLGAANTRTQLI